MTILKVSLQSLKLPITERLGLEGTILWYWTCHSSPPTIDRDTFHQSRVLPAPSNPALSTARKGAATAALGSLGQGLTTLMGKNFFLISNLNLPRNKCSCNYLDKEHLSITLLRARMSAPCLWLRIILPIQQIFVRHSQSWENDWNQP